MKSDKNILSEKNVNECTSCQFCESICPVNAISFSLNEEGFYRPEVSDACVECGLCQKFCYKYKIEDVSDDWLNKVICYSAKSKDKTILKTSASGGISTVLFNQLLKEGYSIVGVRYNPKTNRAETVIIDNENELDHLKGSKYMQTRSENIYKKIMKSSKKFAIIGTPCSIYPISDWAHKMKQDERFIFIDFFCHGTPSLFLWKKYSESFRKKLNYNDVKFRSKHYGWHEFCHEFISNEKNIFSKTTERDPFFTMFFDNHLLNNACYGCKCRDTFEYCDIRLGDYWGSKFDTDVEGVSIVILKNDKAQKLFKKIKNKIIYEHERIEDIIKEQAFKKKYDFNNSIRKKYLKNLALENDIYNIYRDYLKEYSLLKRFKRYLKICVKKMPQGLIKCIRKIYHLK